jgi:DNA cross-link repair 1A protein
MKRKTAVETNSLKRKTKPLPSFKRVIGTSFVVDCFSYGSIEGCSHYFLSHFHSDHYTGLTSNFDWGPIICSPVTANLVISELGINSELIRPLPLGSFCKVLGVHVALINANQYDFSFNTS